MDIQVFNEKHAEVMKMVEQVKQIRTEGNLDEAEKLEYETYELFRNLAQEIAPLDVEPLRSEIHRDAAEFAMSLREYRQAEKFIATALVGEPSELVGNELRDLLDKVLWALHVERMKKEARYVETVEELIRTLLTELSDETLQKLKKMKWSDLISTHFDLGMYIRNQYLRPSMRALQNDIIGNKYKYSLDMDGLSSDLIEVLWLRLNNRTQPPLNVRIWNGCLGWLGSIIIFLLENPLMKHISSLRKNQSIKEELFNEKSASE